MPGTPTVPDARCGEHQGQGKERGERPCRVLLPRASASPMLSPEGKESKGEGKGEDDEGGKTRLGEQRS